MGNPAPFTLTIDSSSVEAVNVKHGVAEVAFRLPGCFNFTEPHLVRLVHLGGFGDDHLLAECQSIVTDSPYGVTSRPVLGYSNPAFSYPVLMHHPRIGISHTLRVSKLFGAKSTQKKKIKAEPFDEADAAQIKKNLFIILRIFPRSWRMNP